MATHYLIMKKTHGFLTQQLNIFYPLKDLRSLLSSKFPSLNPSRSFLKCFIIFTSYPYSLLYFFYFYLFPGILEFWCLATVTFKFTVLCNNIGGKKNKNIRSQLNYVDVVYDQIFKLSFHENLSGSITMLRNFTRSKA